jgi:hypothetical protein
MRLTQFAATLLLAAALVACGSNHAATVSSAANSPNTLASETANNTSAANNFPTQTNGNLGANNVSKLDIHSLLYSGATTKVFAQLLLWFGQSNHMNVGYSSTDPAQVQRQVADMISRGIDGVIIDWYGPNNAIDQATQLVMHEAESHPGFNFAIMVDAGAVGANLCSGCSPQQALIQLLQYVEQNYFVSSAYLKFEGQPVVTDFNIDNSYSIDWDAVNAALPTPPRFLFQDGGGFTHILSDGSYSWVMPQYPNYGLGYLSAFYDTGLSFTSKETVGATYKGFNDSLASWGSNRFMDQQCGQTWLQTFSQINTIFSAGRQLPFLQLVTWNDYEEGTEIESGIDSCFSLSLSLQGNTLAWNVAGPESTIDHYAVYASTNQTDLTELTEIKPGTYSVDLCSLPVPAGNTELFVQAVGKPSLANRMPGPVNYTSGCGSN